MQVFFAVTKVVLELVSLVLERVKGLVLNLPPGPSSLHQPIYILF